MNKRKLKKARKPKTITLEPSFWGVFKPSSSGNTGFDVVRIFALMLFVVLGVLMIRENDFLKIRYFRSNEDRLGLDLITKNKILQDEDKNHFIKKHVSIDGQMFLKKKFPIGSDYKAAIEYLKNLEVSCSSIQATQKASFVACQYTSTRLSSLFNLDLKELFKFNRRFLVLLKINRENQLQDIIVEVHQEAKEKQRRKRNLPLKNTNINEKFKLDSKTAISKRADAVDEIIRKKTKPQKITPQSKELSKIKSKDGSVELSVDKLSVLPATEESMPEIDVVGGVEIHLDKPRKKKLTNEASK
ncbi:MAG: hypothetical protein AAF849_18320 [Bacteroidota bacterium]